MNDLEKALKEIQPPDIRVPRFKQELRRDLRRMEHPRGLTGYRLAFLAACAFSLIISLFAGALLMKPELTRHVRSGLGFQDAGPAYGSPVQLADNNDAQGVPMDNEVLRQLLDGGSASPAVDRAILEDWYRQQMPGNPIQVRTLEEEKIYAVRTFQMTGGKRVMVYTELGGNAKDEKKPRGIPASAKSRFTY